MSSSRFKGGDQEPNHTKAHIHVVMKNVEDKIMNFEIKTLFSSGKNLDAVRNKRQDWPWL